MSKSSSSQIFSAVQNRGLLDEVDCTSLVASCARLEVFKADRSFASLDDDEDATLLVKASAELTSTHPVLGLRGRHHCSNQRSNRNRAPCVASTAVGTEGEEDQMARSSA